MSGNCCPRAPSDPLAGEVPTHLVLPLGHAWLPARSRTPGTTQLACSPLRLLAGEACVCGDATACSLVPAPNTLGDPLSDGPRGTGRSPTHLTPYRHRF